MFNSEADADCVEGNAEVNALARAERLLVGLAENPSNAVLSEAGALLKTLRNQRSYQALLALAEAIARVAPDDAASRNLQAQGLIETGAITPALAVLSELLRTLPRGSAQWAEASGLVGRCHKQIFFEATRSGGVDHPAARRSLALAVKAYSGPYRLDPHANTWHGVNLLALAMRARRESWDEIAPTISTPKLARRLMTILLAVPAAERANDPWYLPTLAEVALGLTLASGELQPVEKVLAEFLQAPNLSAFQVNSTLRQFTQVWELETLTVHTPGVAIANANDAAWMRRLVDILRARLLQLPGGELQVPATVVAGAGNEPEVSLQVSPVTGIHDADVGMAAANKSAMSAGTSVDKSPHGQLEAVLGTEGPQTFAWWRAGIDAARSVAVIRQRLGRRLGSGFLVRAGDLGLTAQPDELLLLTNHHVVNLEGSAPAIKPVDAEVVFEASDEPARAFAVAALLWTSPATQHDATLLRLQAVPAGVRPLTIGSTLPELPLPDAKAKPRVYVIGYPGGRELSFSFQDNELIDHEGPDAGKPQIDGVCRVHYHAPTEGGSSGSPVFDDKYWQVIALHHMGGRFGMPKLNGVSGSYAANEGLAMCTLAAAVKADMETRT